MTVKQISPERPLHGPLRAGPGKAGQIRRRLLCGLLAVLLGAASVAVPAPAHADVERGDSGQEVIEVQYTLRALGYSLAVDGQFGLQTDRVVRAWQRANGLVVDGIVGPATTASLSRAVRVSPPPDASTAGPAGLPAPLDLPAWMDTANCREMSQFMQVVGLPADPFLYYGWREARCENDAPPSIPAASCCRGWWAIHKLNITAPGYAPGARACGIRTEGDYYGTSYSQKLASACFAKVLYDWWITHPGSANPWRL